MFKNIPVVRIDGDQHTLTTHEVIEEVPYAVFVNGRHMMTAMLSPVALEDFVVGYLFTEQIIRATDDIESIRCEKNRISVLTRNLFTAIGPKKTILSGCGGAASYLDAEKLPSIRSDFSVTHARIRETVKAVLTSDLHVKTGGIHILGLAGDEEIITRSEDIGRHNALDRVIGYGLRNGVDFSRTFAVCSGRISSEMARKCLTANIPLIVSRGATTSLAVDIARKKGLSVTGFVRGTRMVVYAHPERITGLESFPQEIPDDLRS
jgi:FdhD protein